jgi:hypothetical protein
MDRIDSFKLNKLDDRLLENKDDIILIRDGKYMAIERQSLFNLSYLMDSLVVWIEIHFQGAVKLDLEKARSIAQAKQLFNQAKESLEVGDPQKLLSSVREYRKFDATMNSSDELRGVHEKIIEYLQEVASRCSTPDEALFALALRQEAGSLFSDLPPIQVEDVHWKGVIAKLNAAFDFKEELLDLANLHSTPQEAVVAMALRDKASYCLPKEELFEIDLKGIFSKSLGRELDKLKLSSVSLALAGVERAKKQLAEAKDGGSDQLIMQRIDELNVALTTLATAMAASSSEVKDSSAFKELGVISGMVDRLGNSDVQRIWSDAGENEFRTLRDLRGKLALAFKESKELLKSLAIVESEIAAETRELREREKLQNFKVEYPEVPRQEVKPEPESSGWFGWLSGSSKKEPSPLHSIADWAKDHGLEEWCNTDQLRLVSADLYLRSVHEGMNPDHIFEGHTSLKQKLIPGGRSGALTGSELMQQVDALILDVDKALESYGVSGILSSNYGARKRELESQIEEQKKALNLVNQQLAASSTMMFYQTQKMTIEARIKELKTDLERLSQPVISAEERRLIALRKWLSEAKSEAQKIVNFTNQMTSIADEVSSRQLQRGELHKRRESTRKIVPQSDGLIQDLNSLEGMLTLGKKIS